MCPACGNDPVCPVMSCLHMSTVLSLGTALSPECGSHAVPNPQALSLCCVLGHNPALNPRTQCCPQRTDITLYPAQGPDAPSVLPLLQRSLGWQSWSTRSMALGSASSTRTWPLPSPSTAGSASPMYVLGGPPLGGGHTQGVSQLCHSTEGWGEYVCMVPIPWGQVMMATGWEENSWAQRCAVWYQGGLGGAGGCLPTPSTPISRSCPTVPAVQEGE